MGLFFLTVFFGFFINSGCNVYNEGFLLSFYFFLFFFIVYISFKSQFKTFYVLRILRKYAIFLTLFKVNSSYNNLLKFFLVMIKALLKGFAIKLKACKYVMNVISTNLLNKYNVLAFLSSLCFLNNASELKAACGNMFCSLDKVMTATSLNDSRLYI
jgi:hypothetical protein